MQIDPEAGRSRHRVQGMPSTALKLESTRDPHAPPARTTRTSSRPSTPDQIQAEVSRRPPESLFLSAAWLSACFEGWRDGARYSVLELADEGRPPVWALLGRRTVVRHGVLPVRVVALNQSTVELLDQPWIERNGFFGGSPEQFGRHLALMLKTLERQSDWDELRLGGLVDEHAQVALYQAARSRLACRLDSEQPSFSVDLEAIRTQQGGDYLSALSANTRQQLRRARRLVEQTHGPVVIDQAASIAQALQWFELTGSLHRARWGGEDDDPHSSGFDNHAFVAFHRRVIELTFPTGGIQYLRLRAGSKVLAYLYNFVAGDRVHFYLSGIDYSDPKAKPGMLAHWLAIESNLAAGRRVYDFLAGDARYKRNLSTHRSRTLWLVLQRPRWRLQLEAFGGRVKRTVLGHARHDTAGAERADSASAH